MFNGHKNHADFCKDLDIDIKNSGDKLTVNITGPKDKLEIAEKKLGAMKTLCCDDGGCC